MNLRLLAVSAILAPISGAALAIDAPAIWRDPDTGCAYLVSPQGGITIRHRKDGSVECPEAGSTSRLIEDTKRGVATGLDALQRELGQLRDRFDNDAPSRP
jgi:hypothetical protein